MAFFGKVYKFVREENFEDFLKNTGVKDEDIKTIQKFKHDVQLLKEGDKYKHVFIDKEGTVEQVFQLEEGVDSISLTGAPIKTVTTIDGNTVTQVIKGSKISATFKREYNGDDLKFTITSPMWNGVAYRYYKA